MLDALAGIGKSGFYWLALLLVGLLSEAVALFYQYALEEVPCVMCIQVRLKGSLPVPRSAWAISHS